MCGVVGAIGTVPDDLVPRMLAAITHRGPDDSGVWAAREQAGRPEIRLGNCRLAIIDLTAAGHQPMYGDGSVLSYNGEVFNYAELRENLATQGVRFRSRTDTEVVHALLDREGSGALARLNGMFALAYWNVRKGELLLARDRYGIKPLYFTKLSNGQLLFASEIKALLQSSDVARRVDLEALNDYLRYLWVPGPKTMFDGIFKLPPGHFMTVRGTSLTITKYWDVDYSTTNNSTTNDHGAADYAEAVRQALTNAVRRHLISDVPVGLSLSGGLDSSALLALMSREAGERVRTYTIAYRTGDAMLEQAGQLDAQTARSVAASFNADHHELVVAPDIIDLLPDVVVHMDEPVADPAALATLLISREASRDVKVLLSGQGADELFGGYRLYLAHQLAVSVGRWPIPADALLGYAAKRVARLPTGLFGVSKGRRLAVARYLRTIGQASVLEPGYAFIRMRGYYDEQAQMRLYSKGTLNEMRTFDAESRHREHLANAPRAGLNQLLYLDMKTFLPDLNLTYMDKMSSSASVEARVPFLDNEVAELAARIPERLKLRNGIGKYILREAMRGIVPDSVLRREKAGFSAPIRSWLRAELRPLVMDLLGEERVYRRGYFNPSVVNRMVLDNAGGKDDQPLRVWALLTFELWHQAFLDSPPKLERPTVVVDRSEVT